MNNNEACAEYFRGNSAYRRCFSEFEKKWKTYGKVTGIITLKNTSEEERRAIGGILGKTFYENTIRFPFPLAVPILYTAPAALAISINL